MAASALLQFICLPVNPYGFLQSNIRQVCPGIFFSSSSLWITLKHPPTHTPLVVSVYGFTLSCFTLSDQIRSSLVACGQQLSLSVFATQFTKVPAADMEKNEMFNQTIHVPRYTCPVLFLTSTQLTPQPGWSPPVPHNYWECSRYNQW